MEQWEIEYREYLGRDGNLAKEMSRFPSPGGFFGIISATEFLVEFKKIIIKMEAEGKIKYQKK